MKVRVPIANTIGKSVQFDPNAGARAEAAVAALAAQISASVGGSIRHSSLQGLQVGDDHPQYTGNQFPETITGLWNFETIPLIQGDTLAEYIEDVVGGSFFDFLQDTTSVVWTFFDTANELEANVPPEFVQDVVGAMLVDTTSVDLAYNDGAGTFTASIIDEYVQDLVGAMLADTTSIDLAYNDAAGTFSASIIDEYVQDLVGAMFTDSSSIDFTYGDLAGTITAATINANPSGLIGMSAVNGTAATPLRSDGRHAIDPAIVPTWTGLHTFTNEKLVFTAGAGTAGGYLANIPTLPKATLDTIATGVGNFYTERLMRVIRSAAPVFGGLAYGAALTGAPAAVLADVSLVDFRGSGYFGTNPTDFADGMQWQAFAAENWSSSNRGSYATVNLIPLTTNSLVECLRLSPTFARFPRDNIELQLGVSQDLRLYHDGTNSVIRNDTGRLDFNVGATRRASLDANGNWVWTGAGTNQQYLSIVNTGGNGLLGVESSAAGGTFAGSTAYAMIFGSDNATDLCLASNSTVRLTINGARVTSTVPIKLKGYTVATLPAGTVGDSAYVTDALAPTFLVAVAGGGTITTPVFYNGTAWVAG